MSLNRTVRLADQTATLPMPGAVGSLAPQGPFTVSIMDPFWSACLADGSIVFDIAAAAETPEADPPKKPTKS